MRSLASLIFLSLVFSACSMENPSELSGTETESAPNPVIVTMGGFNSCEVIDGVKTPEGGERWVKSEELTSKFAGAKELWLRSCYDKWGNIHYISSLDPSDIRTTHNDDLAGYLSRLTALTEQGRNPVFLIGHSHGGWLAMEIARRLPEWVRVMSLTTNDPISPRHCTPVNYIAAIASPSASGIALAGCRQAPADMNENIRSSILARMPGRGWRHYYQRNFLPLSSSPFTGDAQPHLSQDLSSFLSFRGVLPSWNAHTGIDQLTIVWHSFEVSIDRVVRGLD